MIENNTQTLALGAVYDSPRVRVVQMRAKGILCLSGEGTEKYGEGTTYTEIIWS